jgi:hypothetical protein
MIQVPIEIVKLHDAIRLAPSDQHKIHIISEYAKSPQNGTAGQFLTIMPSHKVLLKLHKGDGKINCWYCGHPLDNSLSRVRGCGPICIQKYGSIPGREKVEVQITNIYLEYVKEQRVSGKKHLGIRKWLDTLPDDKFTHYWKKFVEDVDPVTRRRN